MRLHPVQRFSLVLQTIVQTSTLLHFFTGQESIGRNTVIERDDHDVHARCNNEARSVKIRICVRVEAPALDEEVHRELRVFSRIGWGVHVKEETIFTLPWRDGLVGDPLASAQTYGAMLAWSADERLLLDRTYLICPLQRAVY